MAVAPVSAAYSDGFEVVVYQTRDGAPVNVRSLPLRDATQAVADGAQALLPSDLTGVQKMMRHEKSGDSQSSLLVTPLGSRKQQVRLSFHESNRTFTYEYSVDGSAITPLSSEYDDIGHSSFTRYSNN